MYPVYTVKNNNPLQQNRLLVNNYQYVNIDPYSPPSYCAYLPPSYCAYLPPSYCAYLPLSYYAYLPLSYYVENRSVQLYNQHSIYHPFFPSNVITYRGYNIGNNSLPSPTFFNGNIDSSLNGGKNIQGKPTEITRNNEGITSSINGIDNFLSPTLSNENIGSPLNGSKNVQVKQLIYRKNLTDFSGYINSCLSMKLSDDVGSFIKSGRRFIDKYIRKIYYCILRNVNNDKILISIDISVILKYFFVECVIVIIIRDKTGEIEYFDVIINEENKLIFSNKTNFKGEYTTILCFFDKNLDERFRTSFKLNDLKEIGRYYENSLNDKTIKKINNFIEKYKKCPEEFQGDSLNLISEEMCKAVEKKVDDMKEKINKVDCKNEKKMIKKKEKVESLTKNIRNLENQTYENIKNTIYSSVEDDEMKKEILICCFDALLNVIRENKFGCGCPAYDQFAKDYIQSKKKTEIKFLIIENFIEEYSDVRVHKTILSALKKEIKCGKINKEVLNKERMECLKSTCNLENLNYGKLKEIIFTAFNNVENVEKGKLLLISCFDEYYKEYNEGNFSIEPEYVQFVNEYFIIKKEKTIVYTMNDLDTDDYERELSKRRHDTTNEDLMERKKQRIQ